MITKLQEILDSYGLTEDELEFILSSFSTVTMAAALRMMYKSPSMFYWEDSEEDDFSAYSLYQIANQMLAKKTT